MSQQRICGVTVSSVWLLTVLYLVDRTMAALDGYIPGEDYPIYEEVPKGLSFTCDDKIPGYYADPETMCQVWHWCVPSIGGNIMYSFVCAPGTVFNQRSRVCDWFFKVDCPSSPAFYSVNEDLYKDEAGNYIAGKNLLPPTTDPEALMLRGPSCRVVLDTRPEDGLLYRLKHMSVISTKQNGKFVQKRIQQTQTDGTKKTPVQHKRIAVPQQCSLNYL